MQSLPKFQWNFSQKNNPKVSMEPQKISNSPNNLENKAGVIRFPDFKLCYKTIAIKTEWYWYKPDIEQCNRIKSPKINPCTQNHLIFDEGAKNGGQTRYSHAKKIIN